MKRSNCFYIDYVYVWVDINSQLNGSGFDVSKEAEHTLDELKKFTELLLFHNEIVANIHGKISHKTLNQCVKSVSEVKKRCWKHPEYLQTLYISL